jgi:hypothetical protein
VQAKKNRAAPPGLSARLNDQTAWMLLACFLPLLPAVISKETF